MPRKSPKSSRAEWMTAKRNDTPKPRVSLMGVLRAQARRETITGTARAKERIIYSITDMIVK